MLSVCPANTSRMKIVDQAGLEWSGMRNGGGVDRVFPPFFGCNECNSENNMQYHDGKMFEVAKICPNIDSIIDLLGYE